MAFTRGSRLACFYCGKRASMRYDGKIREFLCLNCDATNYLDEHGNITDPPVATTSATSATQYAVSLSTDATDPSAYFISDSRSSASADTSASLFCATCLKNQSLFTACLAQYDLEDDADPAEPSASFTSAALPASQRARPEALQRRYYDFRRRLERLYPQCCPKCEPHVMARVEQTRYTAKTDHLRRMMERSRADRNTRSITTKSTLDRWAAAGKTGWWAGLAAQLLWHFSSVVDMLAQTDLDFVRGGVGDLAWGTVLRARGLLPQDASRLAAWGVWMALGSIWWNPEFTKVWRGFSRHILGLGQWYGFQCMIVLVRLMARNAIGGVAEAKGIKGSALPTAHVFAAGLMVFIYYLASKTIRLDTTPLFGTTDTKTTTSTTSPSQVQQTQTRRGDEPKSLSDLLDEALESSAASRATVARSQTSTPDQPLQPLRPGHQYRNQTSPTVRLGGLSISGPKTPQRMTPSRVAAAPREADRDADRDADEMDWSPVPIPPRAFRNLSSFKYPRAFTETPTQADPPGAFWYKVPPAPLAPAHRARNPPMAPRILAQPKTNQKNEVLPARFGKAKGRNGGVDNEDENWDRLEKKNKGTSFAEPTFFAADTSGDPANSLADMLGASFSLGQDIDETENQRQLASSSSSPSPSSWPFIGMFTTHNARLCEAAVISGILGVWLHTTSTRAWYRSHVVLGTLLLATIVAIWRGLEACLKPLGQGKSTRTGSIVLSMIEAIAASYLALLALRAIMVVREDDSEQLFPDERGNRLLLNFPDNVFLLGGYDAVVVGTGLLVGMALRRITHAL